MYFDTAYLAKLYILESDSLPVRELVADAQQVVCSGHGRVELAFIFHRKFREGAVEEAELGALMEQVERDTSGGFVRWLPNDMSQLESAARAALDLPRNCFLRAADALHLVCARDHGFKTVYSNDKNLLAAARHFGVRGRNVIGKT
ncbi:MAG: type II toxin-antitoxin system VapC family toxin [Chthoniobacterales bacterium]